MEQRRLRLGDILDDYCPRERRLTNHAVVAMIEEDIKQTRCTTCDAEHAYKGGKVPKRRKKETTGALYKEVLAGHDSRRSAHRLLDSDANRCARAGSRATTRRPSVSADAAPIDRRRRSSNTTSSRRRRRSEETDAGDCARDRRRSRASAADPRAASADRRPEGRAPAAGVHDSSARRQRPLPRRRCADEAAAAPGGNGQAGNGGNGNRPQGGSRFAGQRPAGPAAAASRARRSDSQDSGRAGRPVGGRKRIALACAHVGRLRALESAHAIPNLTDVLAS